MKSVLISIKPTIYKWHCRANGRNKGVIPNDRAI